MLTVQVVLPWRARPNKNLVHANTMRTHEAKEEALNYPPPPRWWSATLLKLEELEDVPPQTCCCSNQR